jgi:hypothetical protein
LCNIKFTTGYDSEVISSRLSLDVNVKLPSISRLSVWVFAKRSQQKNCDACFVSSSLTISIS